MDTSSIRVSNGLRLLSGKASAAGGQSSLARMAKTASMGENKLKQLFGTSPYAYYQAARAVNF
jgi:hypothetical protein